MAHVLSYVAIPSVVFQRYVLVHRDRCVLYSTKARGGVCEDENTRTRNTSISFYSKILPEPYSRYLMFGALLSKLGHEPSFWSHYIVNKSLLIEPSAASWQRFIRSVVDSRMPSECAALLRNNRTYIVDFFAGHCCC